jgi:hypothetical protein
MIMAEGSRRASPPSSGAWMGHPGAAIDAVTSRLYLHFRGGRWIRVELLSEFKLPQTSVGACCKAGKRSGCVQNSPMGGIRTTARLGVLTLQHHI